MQAPVCLQLGKPSRSHSSGVREGPPLHTKRFVLSGKCRALLYAYQRICAERSSRWGGWRFSAAGVANRARRRPVPGTLFVANTAVETFWMRKHLVKSCLSSRTAVTLRGRWPLTVREGHSREGGHPWKQKTLAQHGAGMGSRLRGNDAAVLHLTPYTQQSGTIARRFAPATWARYL